MTSPLRRKRPTTRRGPSHTPRRALSLGGLLGLLLAAPAAAQEPASPYGGRPPQIQPVPMRAAPLTAPNGPATLAPPTAGVPVPGDLLPPMPARMSLSFSKPAGTSAPPAPAAPPVRHIGPVVPVKMQPAVRKAQTQPRPSTGQPQTLPPPELSLGSEYATPGPERVFGHLDSEEDLQEWLRQKDKQKQFGKGTGTQTERALFPPRRPLTTEPYQPRAYAGVTLQVEPNYVCYQRLYFEQKNFERYGWDLGPITPFVTTLVFCGEVVALPYNFAKQPCLRSDCSAGQCLPGSPTPFLLWPPSLSVSGGLAEAGTIVALFALFP